MKPTQKIESRDSGRGCSISVVITKAVASVRYASYSWEAQFEQLGRSERWIDAPWMDAHWNGQSQFVDNAQIGAFWVQALPEAWPFTQIHSTTPF